MRNGRWVNSAELGCAEFRNDATQIGMGGEMFDMRHQLGSETASDVGRSLLRVVTLDVGQIIQR